MLPSMGYFKTIDCPFYSNDLCHRFYCHFRHYKKETISSVSNLASITNNTDELIHNDTARYVTNPEIEENINNNVNKNTTSQPEKNTSIRNCKLYLPPDDIPPYNPTPISKLNIKNKHLICENVEHITKNVSNHKTSVKREEFGIQKCSDLAKDLINYFLESDILDKIVSSKINEIKNTTGDSISTLVTESERLNPTNVKYDNVRRKQNDVATGSNIDGNQIVHMNLKEITNVLLTEAANVIDKEYDSVLTVDEKLKASDNITEKNCDKNQIDFKDSSDKSLIDSNFKSEKSEDYNNSVSNVKGETKKSKKHLKSRNKYHKSKNNESPKHKKGNSGHHKKHNIKYSQIYSTEENNASEINFNYKKPEQIVISDTDGSEQYDEFDEILCSIQGRQKSETNRPQEKRETEIADYDEFDEIVKSIQQIKSPENKCNDKLKKDDIVKIFDEEQESNMLTTKLNSLQDFPEAKKKIRVSHVKYNTVKFKEHQHKPKTPCSSSPEENEFPQPKKKKRIAHSKSEHNYVTLKTTDDYLSHWESVKERVKFKCVNPSGEEGYQNWSKVKISPVLNVSSILNSKKLLYAKINRWNSNKK